MSKKARKGTIVNVRRIIGICLVAMLVVGCALLVMQKHSEQQRIANLENLQNLYGGKAKAQAMTEASSGETPDGQSGNVENSNGGSSQKKAAPIARAKRTTVKKTSLSAPAAPAQPQGQAAVVEQERVFQEDFAQLYAINPDLVGWIDVGNYMSMPVVYKDNSFYLNHDYYGEPDNAGTLFINEANTIWATADKPADQNLLFHGHNMRDGSIFGDLDDYRMLDYMQKNVLVYFRTIYDYDPIPYVIYSAFDMSATPGEDGYFDVGYINFDDDAEFEQYTSSVIRRSMYNMPFGVERNDRMLTLFTCSYSSDNGRYVLFCRALHADETPKSILEQAQLITKK